MNELTLQQNSHGKTMDSRDLADILETRHSDLIKSIETQLVQVGYTDYPHTHINEQNGQTYKHYMLPFRETMIIASGYSVKIRAKVIDRWTELEKQQVFQIPKNYSEALRLAADQAEQIEAQKVQLAIAAPKVESFDALQRSEKTMSITQASKYFNLHPKTQVFPYLRERGYLTHKDMPSQTAIDACILAVRKNVGFNGLYYDQAVVLDYMLEKWRTTVVPNIVKWSAE
jgi:phage antirepressor YoqD-like protein